MSDKFRIKLKLYKNPRLILQSSMDIIAM